MPPPHLRAMLLVAVAVLGAGAPSAQTPPQHYFEWTELSFAPDEYRGRREAMIDALAASGGGVYLTRSHEGTSHGETFRQLDDFLYFTGLELPRSVLAIDADRRVVTLFVPGTDRRFADPARRNDFPGRRLARDPELAARTGLGDFRLASELGDALAKWEGEDRLVRLDPGRNGLEPRPVELFAADSESTQLVTWLRQTRPKLRLRSARDEIAGLRMVKSPAEIDVLRRAAAITAGSMAETARAIRPGVDERTLEGTLERGFKTRGAQRRAFDSIIKSGPNSLWPWRILATHYDRRNRAMERGELVIFDVGCELDHYASDVGRTFPVAGAFTERQRELVEMVTAAADAVIAATRPGVTLAELQQVARAAIPAAERRHMQAGLFYGHHVGLAVGDAALTGAPLPAGAVFTVEPWYYNHDEEIAVFVEDMVLVTDTGAVNLTASLPRTSGELEAMVGPAVDAGPHLRILSYNVRHGEGMDHELDLARTARVIERTRPDLVALQEIDLGTNRTGSVDQARRLGELTGMHAVFGEFMEYDGGRYGMALLSRHPIERADNHRLPDGAEPRSALAAHVRLTGTDRRLVLVGLHLYRTEEERFAQASRVAEIFGAEATPVILAGDLNSEPGTRPMRALLDRWQLPAKRNGQHTFPASEPDQDIDHVLLPRDGPFRLIEYQVIDEPSASDHRPVLAVLAWRE